MAVLTLSEELGEHLQQSELSSYYRMAESLLSESQYPEIKMRLGELARRLMSSPMAQPQVNFPIEAPPNRNGATREHVADNAAAPVSLEELVLSYEGELIRNARVFGRQCHTRSSLARDHASGTGVHSQWPA